MLSGYRSRAVSSCFVPGLRGLCGDDDSLAGTDYLLDIAIVIRMGVLGGLFLGIAIRAYVGILAVTSYSEFWG